MRVQVELLEQMVCPYCGGDFRIRRSVDGDDTRLRYGLVACRCFVFPVVDGILLLSLAKGYGGAEEALQPYVPLQVAAVTSLERGDVAGLQGWMRRHAPLAAQLIDGTDAPYLTFAARVEQALEPEVRRFLAEQGKYDVVGHAAPSRLATLKAAVRRRLTPAEDGQIFPGPLDYYASRFFSPRVNALALQLDALPSTPRLLSLCCGHGVFENLLRVARDGTDVVSVDGQFLNLLVARRYARHDGTYLCHDLQFPLPFRDGAFDGVFSSTCLPEIPTQRTFVTEAIRVTSGSGWTAFDSIWNSEIGAPRIDPQRHYRFCQNFFASLDEYVPMFEACAGDQHRVGIDVPAHPTAYLAGPRWAFDAERAAVLAARADPEISVLVLGPSFAGFVEPHRGWLQAPHLAASPAFDAAAREGRIELRRRPAFEELNAIFAPHGFAYPETATVDLGRVDDRAYLADLFTAGLVSVVPPDFTGETQRVLPGAGTSGRPSSVTGGAAPG
jgi:hypothetical protein